MLLTTFCSSSSLSGSSSSGTGRDSGYPTSAETRTPQGCGRTPPPLRYLTSVLLFRLLTVSVPQDVERLDRALVQLQVVPQNLDQDVLAVLGHPVTRDLKETGARVGPGVEDCQCIFSCCFVGQLVVVLL